MRTQTWRGAAYGLASAALFGASTPFAKLLLEIADPWLLAGLLYLGSGIGLFAFSQARRISGAAGYEAPLRRADFPWLAGAIIAGGVIGPVLLMFGLQTTPASSAALLLNLEGLATIAIAWFAFKEHTDARIALGALSILAGAVVLAWMPGVQTFGVGALALAAACFAWGVDNNLTRKISNADPLQIAMLKGLCAGSVNLLLAFSLGAKIPAPLSIAAAGVVGFLGYGVSLVLFVLALRHVGAARAGAYFSTAPFVGAAAGLFLLREPLTVQLMLAALLMGAGVALHLAERHAHQHTHEPLAHEHAHEHDAHHLHDHQPGHASGEPHSHWHVHAPLTHSHPHFPDAHHTHRHV